MEIGRIDLPTALVWLIEWPSDPNAGHGPAPSGHGAANRVPDDSQADVVRDASTPTGSATALSLAGVQDAHFGARAALWTDRYRSSPSFRARLNVVGRAIDDVLHDHPQAKVLDFGGGTGLFSAVASRSARFTVCVDRSQPMLVEGMADPRTLVDAIQSEGFDGPLGTIFRIAGDDRCVASLRESFDLILAIAVVEYVADTGSLIARLAQHLDQGGTLLITVPNQKSLVRIAQRIARPLIAQSRASTGRLADQSFLELRPHGDRVPWRHATTVAGLVVKKKRTVPLGLSGTRRWFHPSLLISLERRQDHRD
jgi:2-polyprenyl-3-methyl-5-hydroxy-6-metoxy-1,4-benzoquinol methylase